MKFQVVVGALITAGGDSHSRCTELSQHHVHREGTLRGGIVLLRSSFSARFSQAIPMVMDCVLVRNESDALSMGRVWRRGRQW